METLSLRGEPVRDQVLAQLKERLRGQGRPPGLGVILAGEDPASAVYVGRKEKACAELGYRRETHRFPAAVTTEQLLDRLHRLNEDPFIDGILVQLPLPSQVDSERILAAIDPVKDVDGFHPENLGRLLAGRPRCVPCTPKGVVRLLQHHGVPIAGRRVVIVGRSVVVGRPLAMLMSLKGALGDATVTLCHSATRDLPSVVRQGEIVVAAIGSARALGREHIAAGAVVVDVGINRLPPAVAGGKPRLVGDVDAEALAGWASAVTPVPGGVGPMTIAMLMENTWEAMCAREAEA